MIFGTFENVGTGKFLEGLHIFLLIVCHTRLSTIGICRQRTGHFYFCFLAMGILRVRVLPNVEYGQMVNGSHTPASVTKLYNLVLVVGW